MLELRLDHLHRLALSVQQRRVRVTKYVPRNARRSGRLTRGIENAPQKVVCVERSALLVGKYQGVGMRSTSLLLSMSYQCRDHLRPDRKVSDAAQKLRRAEMTVKHRLANLQDAASVRIVPLDGRTGAPMA
jgi:hypothetical protein